MRGHDILSRRIFRCSAADVCMRSSIHPIFALVAGLWWAVLVGWGADCGAAELADDVRRTMPTVTEAYEFLHQNPELGKQEFKAHEFIEARLRRIGFDTFEFSASAPTAVISVLETGRPGPVIALRAEMDARPLEPDTNEPASHQPRSTIAARMHNCGHDAHAAILLGTAELLFANKSKLSGKIVFLFQPAEETPGGADDIVHDGILSRLGVTRIFAAHAAPGLPVGTISLVAGPSLAGSNYFSIKLKGRGSHAAAPYDGDDILLLATHLVQELSYLPARRVDIANRPLVVSVTKLVADSGASNVLPTSAEIHGTVRAFEDPLAAQSGLSLEQMLHDQVTRFADQHRIDAVWTFRAGSPPTLNDVTLAAAIQTQLTSLWPGTLDTHPVKGMFSEDFAYYTKDIPALYFGLGIAKDGLGSSGVHTPEFTISADALPYGVQLLATLAQINSGGGKSWNE